MTRIRKKAAVISHERSGTHFLMNTLAENFGYKSYPWWNLDFEHGLNFHSPEMMQHYFHQTHNKPIPNILKSHHSAGFFTGLMNYLPEQFYIFYIYRDPRDTMISFRKLLANLQWDEGPKTSSISEFIRLQPSGAMLRYQKKQEQNILHRWKSHVEGWLSYTTQGNANKVIPIRYEDLNLEFEETVRSIGVHIGHEIDSVTRPSVTEKVIGQGEGKVNSYLEILNDDDLLFFESQIGDTMKRLGYK